MNSFALPLRPHCRHISYKCFVCVKIYLFCEVMSCHEVTLIISVLFKDFLLLTETKVAQCVRREPSQRQRCHRKTSGPTDKIYFFKNPKLIQGNDR